MTGLGLAAALPFNSTKGDPLLSLGPVFAIRAKDSVEGEQWALNKGTGGQVLRARYGSVGRVEIRRGVGAIFPGTVTNYISVPDAANLRLTQDIDIAVRYTLESLTPTGWQSLACRWSSGIDRSFQFGITSGGTGLLAFQRTSDGTTVDSLTSTNSLTANGLVVGTTYWFRARTSGTILTFEWAPDSPDKPTSWNAFGGTRTLAGSTFWAGTAPFWVGVNTYTSNDPVSGAVKRVVYGSYGGSTVLDVDFTNQPDLTTSFTCTTGQTVTVTAVNAVDTNDPLLLKKAAENYVLLPGTSLNNVSIPDAANLQPTTSMSYRSLVALEDWTPSTSNLLASQWTTGNDKCWAFSVTTSGNLEWRGSIDLTAQAIITSTLPISSVVSDNEKIAVRVDWTASPAEIKFYYKTVNGSAIDAITSDSDWTQLGTTVTASVPSTSLANSTEAFRFGAHGGTSFMAGKLFAGVLYVNSSLIISADFTTNTNQNSFVCSTGQTVTFNRSSSGRKLTVVTNPVWLLGTDDYLEVLDNNLLDFSGTDDFTVVALIRRWANLATDTSIINKKDGGGLADIGWQLSSGSGTTHYFQVSDGTNQNYDYAPTPVAGNLTLLSAVRRAAANQLEAFAGTVSNGTSIDSTGNITNSTQFRIGRFSGAGGNYGDFELFAVYIFRKALTAAEIAAGVRYWNAA